MMCDQLDEKRKRIKSVTTQREDIQYGAQQADWSCSPVLCDTLGFIGRGGARHITTTFVDLSELGSKLPATVLTEWSDVEDEALFDLAFSSHVLEHTPNPAEALTRMSARLKPGGVLVSVFPNGSDEFRAANAIGFNRLWGRVLPVMLNGPFVSHALEGGALFVGAVSSDVSKLGTWDRKTDDAGDLTDPELLVVWQKP